MPLERRPRSAADGVSLPASAREGTFSHRPSDIQATTSQTHSTLTPWRSEIHAVCFSTRYRSACAEYNLFPIESNAFCSSYTLPCGMGSGDVPGKEASVRAL